MRTKKLMLIVGLGLGLSLAVLWLLGGGPVYAGGGPYLVDEFVDATDSGLNDSCWATGIGCTLRAAIQEANYYDEGGTQINLVAGTFFLTRTGAAEDNSLTGDLDITTSPAITIEGQGAGVTYIDVSGVSERAFDIFTGTVIISGVTILNSHNTSSIEGGGAIRNQAKLTLINSVIYNNAAQKQGGGIANEAGGRLNLVATTVNSNSTLEDGGGIYNAAGAYAKLVDANMYDNHTDAGGGGYGAGVYNAGDMDIIGGSYFENDAISHGGAIANRGSGVLTLTYAVLARNTANNWGGALYNENSVVMSHTSILSNQSGADGGGIKNTVSGSLRIASSEINDNKISFPGGSGGGLYNAGWLQLNNSYVKRNEAASAYPGGGIYNSGILAVNYSLIYSNIALSGAGLYNLNGAKATITYSAFDHNGATNSGGGIHTLNANSTVDIYFSTISWNTAGDGGGLANESGSALTMINSTVSQNEATTGGGGGLYNFGVSTATLTNTTFSSNTAASDEGDNIYNDNTVYLKNSLIAYGSLTSNCYQTGSGTNVSRGHNLSSSDTCQLIQSTDLTGTDPLLGPLQDNCGETETHALLPYSPAIDAGDDTACPSVDQRGKARQGVCDIGAYEATYTPELWITKQAPEEAGPGQPITYTLTVGNDGDQQASTLVITDDIPAGASYIQGGTRQGNIVSWTLASLDPYESETFTYVVTATESIVNKDYRVSASDGFSATRPKALLTIIDKPGRGTGVFANNGQLEGLGNEDSQAVAYGDMNGDGYLDCFVANASPNDIWVNNGAGQFVWVEMGNDDPSRAASAWDLDGDGDTDIVLGNAGSSDNSVWLNNGSGTFTTTSSLGSADAYAVALGDLNGDGRRDAVLGTGSGQAGQVWLNDGAGAFTVTGALGSSAETGQAVALADLDGDDDLDIMMGTDGGHSNQVWQNNGSGDFMPGTTLGTSNSQAVALGDLDGDGDEDAFLANGAGEANQVWLNLGNATQFQIHDAFGSHDSRAVALGDIDLDGDLDAFVGNANNEPNQVLLNNGDGTFQVSQEFAGEDTRGVALKDLDQDGDLDVYIANASGQGDRVLLNQNNHLDSLTTGDSHLLRFGDGLTLTLEIPAGVLTRSTVFTYNPLSSPSHPMVTATWQFAGRAFRLTAGQNGEPTSDPFDGQAILTIYYDPLALSHPDEVRLYYWTGSGWRDIAKTCPASYQVQGPNQIRIPLCHLSDFALFEPKGDKSYLPLILKH